MKSDLNVAIVRTQLEDVVTIAHLNDSPKLSRLNRLALIGAGLGAIALLFTAACLRPDPHGYGTHQQLGLPPCTFQLMFHVPCPSCGMTTSWALIMRGCFVEAITASAAGSMLAVGAVVTSPWLIGTGIAGRWLLGRPKIWMIALMTVCVLGMGICQWVWRLGLSQT